MEDADSTALSLEAFIAAVGSPVVVFDRHLDVVAANDLAGAISASFTVGTNLARFTFLNPMVEDTTTGWTDAAADTASSLRDGLNRHEEDQRFREIVGELMALSSMFADLWAGPLPPPRKTGTSVFTNPLVGVMHLAYEQLQRTADDERVVTLWAPIDRVSAQRLDQLQTIVSAGDA